MDRDQNILCVYKISVRNYGRDVYICLQADNKSELVCGVQFFRGEILRECPLRCEDFRPFI